jgi:adenine-specific DNA-methyltransferase
MENNKLIDPQINELPNHFADRLGVQYSKSVNQEHKKARGQFFTPTEIAELMGTFAENDADIVRILDPGCGTAILTCALIEELADKNKNLEEVDLVVYETDSELIPYTKKSLTYLQEWLVQKKINFKYTLHTNDFILENADCLTDFGNLFSKAIETFDIIISNPPYFKLPIDDMRSIAARAIVNGHPNIYAIFMAISARLLKVNGELIFITPRSYASGSYFKLFREYFFKIIEIDNVHLFVSRKETFTRDKVLQETVIIKGTRKEKTNPYHKVLVSSSHGLKDITTPEKKSFKQIELIDLSSNEKILYLPTCNFDESILTIFDKWSGNLNKYNIQISTGPVVAFRSRSYILENYENGIKSLAPLFWLHNVKQMMLEWPIFKPEKGQYVSVENDSKAILIPNKNYILLRRFSTKDDKSRLIAAPYFCNFIKSDYIGVENKVNYIYRPKGHLERNEVVGLCALLNSALFDSFFRIFNGNVNVSATELREIPLPPLETIKEIGDNVILSNDFSVENTNRIVIEQFKLTTSLIYD